jgi:hypothetical protein
MSYSSPAFLTSVIAHGPETRNAHFLAVNVAIAFSGVIDRLSAPAPFSPSVAILSNAVIDSGLPTPRSLGSRSPLAVVPNR